MKENKKGFTLIELLAVIVILAIIALIATPLVLQAINTARKGAAEASANNFISAVEHSIATQLITDSTYVIPSTIDDETTGLTVQYKGDAPEEYSLVVDPDKGTVTGGTMKVNGFDLTVQTNGTAKAD